MSLHPESERQWGNMTLARTLAHCTAGLQMATGVINPQRAPFPASVLGLLIKPLVMGNDKPLRRNSPSSPELFPAHPTQCDLELERAHLISAIDSFCQQGPSLLLAAPTPFLRSAQPAAVGHSDVQTRRPSSAAVWRLTGSGRAELSAKTGTDGASGQRGHPLFRRGCAGVDGWCGGRFGDQWRG